MWTQRNFLLCTPTDIRPALTISSSATASPVGAFHSGIVCAEESPLFASLKCLHHILFWLRLLLLRSLSVVLLVGVVSILGPGRLGPGSSAVGVRVPDVVVLDGVGELVAGVPRVDLLQGGYEGLVTGC